MFETIFSKTNFQIKELQILFEFKIQIMQICIGYTCIDDV